MLCPLYGNHTSVAGALDTLSTPSTPANYELGGGVHRSVAGGSKGQGTVLKSEPGIPTVHETLRGLMAPSLTNYLRSPRPNPGLLAK